MSLCRAGAEASGSVATRSTKGTWSSVAAAVILCSLAWSIPGSSAALAKTPRTVAAEEYERNIRFRRLGIQEGLSQAFVNSILQDRRGFMWFATQGGLNLYDGHSFTVFSHDANDPSSLAADLIKFIIEDRDGVLWVATDGGGLNRFNRDTGTFTRFTHDPTDPTSIGSNKVWALLEDRAGNFWVGTDGAGFYLFDRTTGVFNPFRHDENDSNSLTNDSVREFAEDPDGAIWIATEGGGVSNFDPVTGTFQNFRHDPANPSSLSSDRVRSIMVDSGGEVWAGTRDAGVHRMDSNTSGFVNYRHDPADPHSLAGEEARVIFEDRDGTVWVGTDNGLSRYRRGRDDFANFRHDASEITSLSQDKVVSIFEDRGGVLWVGTFSGLNTWNTSSGFFINYGRSEIEHQGLNEGFVSALAEDSSGDIWIGTVGGGLNRFDRLDGTFDYFRKGDGSGLESDKVFSVFVDQRDSLWAGTQGDGLFKYDSPSGTFTQFRHDPADRTSLSSNAVSFMTEDGDGWMWIATFGGGINRFDWRTGAADRFLNDPDDPASLSSNLVLAMLEDSLGDFYVASYGAGLNILDRRTGEFTVVRHQENDPSSLSKDALYALYEDSRNDLWIGTEGGGASRWSFADRRAGIVRFERITTEQGLASNTVNYFTEDGEGNLWLSTVSGLSRLDLTTGEIKNFDTTHGLQGEFNYGAGLKTSDGKLFFGGIHGFNVFDAARIVRNSHVPPVVITRILKFDQEVRVEDNLEFSHSDAMLTFEFAALDYTAPERNRYLYKLEGFDKNWVDNGGLRRATYTNLPPGNYEFRVKGSNNDGIWNEVATGLRFRIGPPWWRTWTAYTMYLLALSGIVIFTARNQAKKHHRARELAEANEALQLEVEQRNLQGDLLRMEKERAQTYLDVAEVIMLVADTNGVVLLVNQKGSDVLGYTESEIVGQKWTTFVRPDQREIVEEFLREDSSGDYLEYSVENVLGEERIIAWHRAFLRDDDGESRGTLSSGSDVTQILRLREAKESAESASRAKSQFLANMSHEIRTPMNGVLGMIELLSHSGLDDKQRHFADNAHSAARALLDLLNDILDVSKIEAGKLELETIDFEPRAMVEDTMVLFGEQARQKGLQLNRKVDSRVPRVLPGDPVRLRQILSNLVGNAIKFTEDGGVGISVSACSESGKENCIRFEVTDTGVGLEEKTMESIFDPFSQADGSTTRKFGGTGLGLTISRQLVELMGGTLGVDSEEGTGSVFWFQIPFDRLVKSPEATAEFPVLKAENIEDTKEVPVERAKIMLVEDNPLNQEVVHGMLEHLGGGADVAASGRQAIDLFKEKAYDLVLMDCQMPVMDGYEATRRIRSLEGRHNDGLIRLVGDERPERVPIVAMTASALAGERERCFDSGMDDYLGKPFTMEQLKRFLGRWLITPDDADESPRSVRAGAEEAVRQDPVPADESASLTSREDGAERSERNIEPLDKASLDEIRRLEESGVSGLFGRILTIYIDSSPELVQGMKEAIENGDPDQLHAAAHSLKSTSASLGARYLASLCRDLETKGREKDLESAPAILNELVLEFDRVIAALQREIEREAV